MCRYSRPSARAIDERERYGRPQRTVLEVPVGAPRWLANGANAGARRVPPDIDRADSSAGPPASGPRSRPTSARIGRSVTFQPGRG
jgi:hypothetical protein